jgi:hypothetical protein
VETGSAITWKYPSVVLKGDNSVGEFYSVALTNNKQQADTGTKMIHVGKNTRSRIVSKGISAGQVGRGRGGGGGGEGGGGFSTGGARTCPGLPLPAPGRVQRRRPTHSRARAAAARVSMCHLARAASPRFLHA